jgi:lauroyl/myristoyl acyltransferase
VSQLLRRAFCWKSVFYGLFLPLLARLGPARCDAVLSLLGRALVWLQPGARARLRQALGRAKVALDLDGPVEDLWPELAAGTLRTLARDYPLDCRSDHEALGRFEVVGAAQLDGDLAAGRGLILVGSHLGAYIEGLHWLYRTGLPVRALVQRPWHVSSVLARRFEDATRPHAQARLFLKRDMMRPQAVELLQRARAALRDGLAVYLCGDIPWNGPNAQTGRLLGVEQRFLSIWTELAVLTRAPVYHVFCTHQEGGRYRLELQAMGQVYAGEQGEAVADYLRQLEARIANYPAQAVAHLLWPCFSPARGRRVSCAGLHYLTQARPSRRASLVQAAEADPHPAETQPHPARRDVALPGH